jgi:superfamily II DNA/RNA helicase
MVCSDIAARGIDITGVGHIVMFDFPLNPIDYLHR